MDTLAPSTSDDVFAENNKNSMKLSVNPGDANKILRFPTSASCDSLKPKHFHHPEYFAEKHTQSVKQSYHCHANINPESGVDHSSLLEELPERTEDCDIHPDTDTRDWCWCTWYSRWEDKEDFDRIEERQRRSEEKRRKTLEELNNLQCSLGKMFLKEDQEEELRFFKRALDPRASSRSPNANMQSDRKLRYSTPIASSPSRIIKEARGSATYIQEPTMNGDSATSNISVADVNANPAVPDGANSGASSESGSIPSFDEFRCSRDMVQSMPDIRSLQKILPYQILKTTNKKRPQGVDKAALEKHLHPEEFLRVFSITRDRFYCLPHWKQLEMKKKVHLF